MDQQLENILIKASPIAVELAKKAGKVQLENLGKIKSIEYKGAINLVTEVDKKCEELIVAGLQEHFPDHDILGEEGIGQRQKSDFRWIVDPLDGTTNYAHEFPFFGVSIALEYQEDLVLGVIYDPNRDELFLGVKDKGATLNGEPIRVAKAKNLQESLLATGFAYNVQEYGYPDNLDNFAKFIKVALAVRRPGAAAIDLAYVACGRLDGFWELYLKPWDIAAGIIIIREAGGMVTSFDGSEFKLYGTEILVSNGLIHKQMIEVLKSDRS
ncbi:MAG: inositol monophosphatase family protein [Pseudomonadota bacterium]